MEFLVFKAGFTAFIISIILTPFLIRLSRRKGFFASINHRSSHEESTPNTGGIILGFAILVPLLIFSNYPAQEEFSFLLSAFAVLLITGIIDDFNPIPVVFKFLGQFIPAIVIVMSIDERDLIIPFIGQFIELPHFFNYLFWIIFIVMSINAFNLIDGIDGLAISLGVVGGIFYFLKFIKLGSEDLLIFSITLIAGLLGLLIFNFSKRNKIFIGDTGSLLIGGLLVYFALKFIDYSDQNTSSHSFFLVLGSFFIPFADMIRVALVRIFSKESPFKADRSHIHHLLVDACKGKHVLATGILVAAQIFVIVLFQYIAPEDGIILLIMTAAAIVIYIALVSLFQRYLGKFA